MGTKDTDKKKKNTQNRKLKMRKNPGVNPGAHEGQRSYHNVNVYRQAERRKRLWILIIPKGDILLKNITICFQIRPGNIQCEIQRNGIIRSRKSKKDR